MGRVSEPFYPQQEVDDRTLVWSQALRDAYRERMASNALLPATIARQCELLLRQGDIGEVERILSSVEKIGGPPSPRRRKRDWRPN